jgi:phosphoglucosamine mutase
MLAALKVLEIIEKKGSLSKLVAELPNYITLRKKIQCKEADKDKMCKELFEKVRDLEGVERVTEIDGVRADFKDSWVLVRPSGTEPIVRITVEASSQARADELMQKLLPKA